MSIGISATVREMAARHAVDPDELLEAWNERAAIREYLAGYSRPGAELSALHDVEAIYKIGLHCPETIEMMVSGGDRKRPTGALPMVHAWAIRNQKARR